MLFISATDTGVGKTFFSCKILNEASRFIDRKDIAYFKPIQCGKDTNELFGNEILETDFQVVERCCPEIDTYYTYYFDYPASPDYASKLVNQVIDINKIKEQYESLKSKYKFIVVEGAGGLSVPVNHKQLIIDIPKILGLDCLLVSRSSLGTINHTLMSLATLKYHDVNCLGIIPNEISDEDKQTLAYANPEVESQYEKQIAASFSSIQRFYPETKLFNAASFVESFTRSLIK